MTDTTKPSSGADASKPNDARANKANRPEPSSWQAPSPTSSVGRQAGKTISLSLEEHERLLAKATQAEDYLRQLADVDNVKKRLQREKEEFRQYAAEQVIRALLPIVDSLDQALVAVDKQSDPQAVIRGIHLIYRQVLGLLEREGVRRIPTVGEPFDPHQHEAVAQVEATDRAADGTVVEEVHVGYTMHGKVLRPAMVKVAKKPEDRSQTSEDRGQKTEGSALEQMDESGR